MIDTPLTDLQLALSRAVDLARALPTASASSEYIELIGMYLHQISCALVEARS